MLKIFRFKSLVIVSLLLGLAGCQAVDSYANKMVNLFTNLLSSLTNAIRFPSFR